MADTDPLAEALRQADRVTSGGDYYADMARAAREHIAAEIEAKAQPFRMRADGTLEAPEDYEGLLEAARIARGRT